MTENKALSIGKKSFIISFAILLALMVFAGVITRVVPAGEYDRLSVDGREMVVEGTFRLVEDAQKLPIYKWFTAPIEVLGG